jgi:hypothetical protein
MKKDIKSRLSNRKQNFKNGSKSDLGLPLNSCSMARIFMVFPGTDIKCSGTCQATTTNPLINPHQTEMPLPR